MRTPRPDPPDPDRTTIVYLPDPDLMPDLQPGWPAGVAAAFCLSRDGAAVVLVAASDPDPFPAVSRHLGVPLDEFLVVPPVGGHGTRPFGFADEQAMLAAIEAVPGLAAAARLWAEQAADPPARRPAPPAPARRAPAAPRLRALRPG